MLFRSKIWLHNNAPFKVSDQITEALLNQLQTYITKKYVKEFDIGLIVHRDEFEPYSRVKVVDFNKYFKVKNNNWHTVSHHLSHAAGAFYQSGMDQALVITLDGGSPDSTFNAFKFDQRGVKHIGMDYTTIGYGYAKLGVNFKDIKPSHFFFASMTYPGKIMGLAGYGIPSKLHVEPFKRFLCN